MHLKMIDSKDLLCVCDESMKCDHAFLLYYLLF